MHHEPLSSLLREFNRRLIHDPDQKELIVVLIGEMGKQIMSLTQRLDEWEDWSSSLKAAIRSMSDTPDQERG